MPGTDVLKTAQSIAQSLGYPIYIRDSVYRKCIFGVSRDKQGGILSRNVHEKEYKCNSLFKNLSHNHDADRSRIRSRLPHLCTEKQFY